MLFLFILTELHDIAAVVAEPRGLKVDTVEDLFGELRQHRPGDRVTLTVVREGREQRLTATLADNPNG